MKTLPDYIIGLSLLLLIASVGAGQERVRTLELPGVAPNEPIALIGSQVNGKSFLNKTQVLADADWLSGLKLDVKNISSKPILYIRIDFIVAKQGKMEHPFLMSAVFGKRPAQGTCERAVTEAPPSRIAPNEHVQISLNRQTLDLGLKYLRDSGVSNVDSVQLIYDLVIFDDGSGWSQGVEMRQNPANPEQWDVVKGNPRGTSQSAGAGVGFSPVALIGAGPNVYTLFMSVMRVFLFSGDSGGARHVLF